MKHTQDARMHARTRPHARTHANARPRAHTHTHTHKHTHTHTHTHLWSGRSSPLHFGTEVPTKRKLHIQNLKKKNSPNLHQHPHPHPHPHMHTYTPARAHARNPRQQDRSTRGAQSEHMSAHQSRLVSLTRVHYRMCSLTIECVLLLQNTRPHISLDWFLLLECVLLL